MPNLLRDLRYALRQLRKSPGFAITAIMTLALGIGANVVVFSVLNAIVLKPLNVSHPQSFYNVEHKEAGFVGQSYPDYIDYRDQNTTFSGMVAYDMTGAAISTGKSATEIFGYLASGNYFDLLGVQPVLGRFFHASDERGQNSAPYIVLSYDFWRGYFHGNPDVIGSTVDLNEHPYTVIGIASEQFHGTEIFMWPDFWVPMVEATQFGYSQHFLNNRGFENHWVLGRLKSGVTPQQATQNLNAIASRLAKQYPTTEGGLDARLVKPGLLGDMMGDSIRTFLAGIMLLAMLVLLAACVNLGSLFGARASDRTRELTIRLAVGSTRGQILRQLLTESVLVSLLGGTAGVFFATILLQVLSRWQPFADFPIHVTVYPDAKVYAVALLLSLSSGIFFGLLPAHQIWRTDAAQAMKSGASAVATFRHFTLRDVLLGIQIALCTLLVTASLVALRGMERSLHVPLGFQQQGAMLAQTRLQMAGYSDEQSLPVQKRMIDEVSRIPGVSAVGIIDRAITSANCCGSEAVFPNGTTDFRPSNEAFDARNFSFSPGYLQAAGTRLLSGRDFTWHDDATSPQVVIVNATFARRMFGNTRVVGKYFLLFRGTHPKEIVGVVEDGKYQSLTESPQAAMFFPLSQETNSPDTVLVVRSASPPNEMSSALARVLTGINPNLPLTLESWQEALDFALFPAQVATAALGIMGLLAAMLAVTGTFGMAAYSVSKRMKELGIRIALGAQPAQLMRSALGRPLKLLLTGSITGLILGVLASRLLAQIVYEATPRDPVVLAGVVVAMTFLGALATWIPARRALHIDPNQLLHEE